MKRLFRLSQATPDVPRDVQSEISFHLEMRTQEFIDAGMSPAAAALAAREAFGDVTGVQAECATVDTGRVRDTARRLFMHELMQDLRFAFRTLRASPGFTIAAVLTLGLGIGANTAIFSMIRGVLLRPLPYEDGERLIRLRQPAELAGVENAGFSPLEMGDYKAAARTLDGLVEYHSMPFILLGQDEPRRVQTGVVSAEYFEVVGIKPLLGRTFRPGEDQNGAAPVLVLSYDFWRNQLGGDSAVVGRTFEMNDKIHTVVGVLPPIPQYPGANDVYMPISACPFRSSEATAQNRNARMLTVIGRTRPGVTTTEANAEVAAIGGRLHAEYPEAYPESQGYKTNVASLQEELTRRARPTLLVLLGTAILVLLIACANVANLTLARLLRREHEMALRVALGADRSRLLRQLLTEGTVLSLIGGALGLALAASGVGLLTAFAAKFTPRSAEISIDGQVLGFTIVAALLTGLVFGLLPALPGRARLTRALREGRSATTGTGAQRARRALVVAQVAVSVMLLVGAGLMIRSLLVLQRLDPGFDPENVLTMTLDLNWSKYTSPDLIRDFHNRLQARLADQPGVVSTASALGFPLNGRRRFSFEFLIQGRPADPGVARPQGDYRVVSPGYLRTMGIPLVAGRAFTESDGPKTPEVALINQSMMRRYWGKTNPIGDRISGDNGETWATIVGVVGDVRQYGLDSAPSDEVYSAFAQSPVREATFLVRTNADPMNMAGRIVEAVRAIDPNQPLANVRALEQVRGESLASPRLTTFLLGLFAVLALVITATGLAGVIAFSVSQRTQEIGIRMALGAARGEVLTMVLREGMTLVGLGLVCGIGGAVALTHLMSGLLYGVDATDPLTFVATALLLGGVAAVACLAPARRATAVDPIVALRST
jgi:putative ABC transport system permease protein